MQHNKETVLSRSDHPIGVRKPASEHPMIRVFKEAGITIGGMQPWDIQVHDKRLWNRLTAQGSLGLGEAYMEGWWDCQAIDQMIYRLLKTLPNVQIGNFWHYTYYILKGYLINCQNRARAFEVGKAHYDIGNDLYEAMLDSRLTYTCGYWEGGASNLDEAQEAKLDLICRKLRLEPGMRILDIGCGWGSFCEYAAQHYGANCVGLTISKEQVQLGKQRCADLPVEIRFQDYRDIDEDNFDRVISIGMFEHVGPKNYRDYMEVSKRCLRAGGLSLIHTIGSGETNRLGDPFITHHIFPNGHLPSAAQISTAAEGLFVLEDVHNFGADYDKTLCAWHENVDHAWETLQKQNSRYDQKFQRMWRYYLLSCAGAFRVRNIQLWQWVFSDGQREGVYPRVPS